MAVDRETGTRDAITEPSHIEARGLVPGAGLATVESVEGDDFAILLTDGTGTKARRATSCLVSPAPGDKVLAVQVEGVAFVLAVLERHPENHVPLRIETAHELEIVAERITIRSRFLGMLANKVTAVGDTWNSLFLETQRVVGVERVTAKSTTLNAEERVAVIAGADVQRSTVFSQQVDGPAAIKSKTTVITSDSDIRLNGERINVG